MKTIIPTTVIIIAILIMCCISTSLIAFDLQVAAARNFHTEAIDRMQASYYSDEVIAMLEENAAERGYTLDEVIDMGDIASGGRMTAKVTLDYDAVVPFFGIERHGQIVGIAR